MTGLTVGRVRAAITMRLQRIRSRLIQPTMTPGKIAPLTFRRMSPILPVEQSRTTAGFSCGKTAQTTKTASGTRPVTQRRPTAHAYRLITTKAEARQVRYLRR